MTCPDYIGDRGGRRNIFLSARITGARAQECQPELTVPTIATHIDSVEVWLPPLTNPIKPLA
jgi:hypothetical protein